MTRRLGIRARLLLGFTAALVVSGALMVAVIYVGMRFVPTYDLAPATPVGEAIPPMSAEPIARGPLVTTIALRSKQDVWRMVLATSIVGLLLVIAIGLVVGRVVARRLLAPLRAINRAAATAGAGDLECRVNADGPPDELKELADTFDAMLDKLQELFAAHQRFAANASHELLTPLTTTRSILQVVMNDGPSADLTVLAELAPMLAETNERNITIVTSLLRLAGAEHAQPDADPVDVGALVALVAAERAPAAEASGIHLHVERDQGCEVVGSTPLLRQLVLNLIDNALTYNVPAGRVDLAVHRDGSVVVVRVGNTGPLVAPDITDRLFEPFYRAERSRISSDRSGHGLGLAIVRSIVRAHRGSATATGNTAGGLTVRVELPRAPVTFHRVLRARTDLFTRKPHSTADRTAR